MSHNLYNAMSVVAELAALALPEGRWARLEVSHARMHPSGSKDHTSVAPHYPLLSSGGGIVEDHHTAGVLALSLAG